MEKTKINNPFIIYCEKNKHNLSWNNSHHAQVHYAPPWPSKINKMMSLMKPSILADLSSAKI